VLQGVILSDVVESDFLELNTARSPLRRLPPRGREKLSALAR
jgi:hypothetical protein